MKKIISVTLAVLIMLSAMMCSVAVSSAAENHLNYSFSGEEKNDKGFAEGTITIKAPDSASAGTFYIYWADESKVLDGYRYICKLTVSANSTATYNMLDHTVIPRQATQIVAIKSSSVPNTESININNAAAKCAIPANKRLADKAPLYTFGSVSDPQIAAAGTTSSYPYDETHWKAALECLADRDVDFVIVSGDVTNDQNGPATYEEEYNTYLSILAQSSYSNPIYEANGNHDVHTAWGSTGNSTYGNYNAPFVMYTGLDSTAQAVNENTPYYEVTEPVTGDHFIYMALEAGFRTNEGAQFSTEQLDWLEGLLKKYKDDGKNIFIIEHSTIEGWGSGDKAQAPYYYDLSLTKNQTNVGRFISLMETYKKCVMITGHTHLELGAHLNYTDNNGSAAPMIHNSAIGGVRRLVNGSIDRNGVLGMTEGYFVDVYEDCVIFNGANLYSDEIMPDCSYIIPNTTSVRPTEEETKPTEEPTKATEAPTKATEAPTKATEAPTKATEEPTKPTETQPTILYGDTDLDGRLSVIDATYIQRHLARLTTLTDEQLLRANVTGNADVSIVDATYIQRKLANLIKNFPIEEKAEKAVASTSAGNVMALIPEVKDVLASNNLYASYDQYQEMKKVYNEVVNSGDTSGEAFDKLNGSYQNFKKLLDDIGVCKDGSIDVYFTDTQNWSKVNAYAWGSATNAAWPGKAMELVETNEYNQKIYKITLSAGQYDSIIFNNGSAQTMDLKLFNLENEAFYITVKDCNGKYVCGSYRY